LYRTYPHVPHLHDWIVGGGGAVGVLVAAGQPVYTRHEQFYRLRNCGAMAFFSDMQIVVQGAPIEEIHRYNIIASYMHDMAGIPDCKDTIAMERYFANGKPFVSTVDNYNDFQSNWEGGGHEVSGDTRTGKHLEIANVLEMRMGVTYRAFVPTMSGLLGVLAHTYFLSMLVATGTITIEITVAQSTQACVASRPGGAIAANGNPGNYCASQQQYLGYATQAPGGAVACLANGNTAASMTGWTEAQTTAQTLQVTISKVTFVANQIILPDTIATAVISRAESSNISVMTSSIRAYATHIDSATGNVNTTSRSPFHQSGECKCPQHWFP
jgi:hypothetical protein